MSTGDTPVPAPWDTPGTLLPDPHPLSPPPLEDNREIKERLEQQRQQLEEAQTDR